MDGHILFLAVSKACACFLVQACVTHIVRTAAQHIVRTAAQHTFTLIYFYAWMMSVTIFGNEQNI